MNLITELLNSRKLVNGTTGEGVFSLTDDERMAILEAWVKQKHLIPTIIVQVGGCPLRSAQKLVKFFEMIEMSRKHHEIFFK